MEGRRLRPNPFRMLLFSINAVMDSLPKPTVVGNMFTAYNRAGEADGVGRRLTRVLAPMTGRVTTYERIDEMINNPLSSLTVPLQSVTSVLPEAANYVIQPILYVVDEVRRGWVLVVKMFAYQLENNPVSALPFVALDTFRRTFGVNAFLEQLLFSIGVRLPYRYMRPDRIQRLLFTRRQALKK